MGECLHFAKGERMSEILTLGVSLVFLTLWGGGIFLVFEGVCRLYDFHRAGMARVRAYDQRTKSN